MMKSRKSYQADDTESYLKNLKWAIGLSFLFMVGQCIGWYSLVRENVHLKSTTASAYLYLISILHVLHVVAGIPFLLYFYWKAKKLMIEPVTVLLYFSDPFKRLSLRLLTIYWHFLDILWIYLIVFFVVNSFV
jgi:cytochrome c oxidase subunit 3